MTKTFTISRMSFTVHFWSAFGSLERMYPCDVRHDAHNVCITNTCVHHKHKQQDNQHIARVRGQSLHAIEFFVLDQTYEFHLAPQEDGGTRQAWLLTVRCGLSSMHCSILVRMFLCLFMTLRRHETLWRCELMVLRNVLITSTCLRTVLSLCLRTTSELPSQTSDEQCLARVC